ncbi:MAG: Gfo/Idh/MocA family protein, partial [Bryobacteraceae bacterium]
MLDVSRRYFFVGSAAAAMTSRRAAAQSANSKVVLALIGAGGRGTQLAANFARIENVEFKYICEVNAARGDKVLKDAEQIRGVRPQRVEDMRRTFDDKDVDGVIVATPEHWHALATVWACQAGKDVYVEKNISLSVWEGRKMVEAARKYQRIVQCGTQNRSAPYALTARDYLASGMLGKIIHVKVYNLLQGGRWKPEPDTATPPGVDWDSFLGPAREVPFNPGRLRGWTNFWDYSGGPFSGDASHQFDIARIALGDPPHPRSVYCLGGRYAYDDKCEMPDFQAITWDYGDYAMTCEAGTFTPYLKKFPNEVRYGKTWPNWMQSSTKVEIYGTRQVMYLGQHGAGWQVFEADGKVVAEDKGHFPDKWHQPNFIDCIRDRKRPNGDIEQGHLSATLVH